MKNKKTLLGISLIGLASVLFGMILTNPDVTIAAGDMCEWECNAGFYRNGTQCIPCPGGRVSSPGSTSSGACRTGCSAGTHVAVSRSGCEICGIGSGTPGHQVTGGNTYNCFNCSNGPANKDQYPLNVGYRYTGYGTGTNNCPWECLDPFIKNGNSCVCPTDTYSSGNSCEACPTGSHSSVGSTSVNDCIIGSCPENQYLDGNSCIDCPNGYTGAAGSTSKSQCTITCTGGNHVTPADTKCTICSGGFATYHHTVTGGEISHCVQCQNKPDIGAHYIGPGSGNINSCPWECVSPFIKSGNNSCVCPADTYLGGNSCEACPTRAHSSTGSTLKSQCECPPNTYLSGNKCVDCPNGAGYQYESQTGSTSINDCKITCLTGEHVSVPKNMCKECTGGTYTTGNRTIYAPQSYLCDGCTNGPVDTNTFDYTDHGTGNNNCPWDCKSGFIKSGNSCVCPAGKYQNGSTCVSCGGAYTSNTGATSKNQCRTKCDPGEHVNTGGNACVSCGTGYATGSHTVYFSNKSYCISCTNGPTNKNQYPLNVGYYYTSNGTSVSTCDWQCSSGYYLSGTYSNGKCLKCPTGYYTPDGSGQTSVSACKIDCPANTYVATGGGQCRDCEGQTQKELHEVYALGTSSCVDWVCPSGQYYDSASNSCKPCPANQYYDSASNSCKSCPTGYTSSIGSIGLSSCSTGCKAGEHVNTGGNTCVSCGIGYATGAHTVYASNESYCVPCTNKPPQGAYYTSTGSTPNNCKWKCDSGNGFITGSNGNSCVCPANHYSNGTTCIPCEPGYTSPAGSISVNACKVTCTGGNHVATGGQGCVPCNKGSGIGYATGAHTVSGFNTSTCIPCISRGNGGENLGNGSGANNTCPWRCKANYYKNGTTCTACHGNYYHSDTGSDSESDCKVTCLTGLYVESPYENCQDCPIGTYTTGNRVVPQGTKSSCLPCTGGPADTNTFDYTGRGTGNNNCPWACKSGFIKSGNSCVCPAGKYQNGSSCVDCGGGYTSNAGATSKNQCRIECKSGEHVNTGGNACVSCGTGYATGTHIVYFSNKSYCVPCTNKPSIGAYYTSTGSTSTNCPWKCDSGNGFITGSNGNSCVCPANKYLSGSRCVDCEPGYTSPAGSVSVNSCTITCTGGNHVATGGQGCVPCPSGSFSKQHTVSGYNKSSDYTYYNCPNCYCARCANISNAVFIGNGSGANNTCPWVCKANYYKNGTTCTACTNYYLDNGYHSDTGSTLESDCKVTCLTGAYVPSVSSPRKLCQSCNNGQYTTGKTIVPQGTRSYCLPCTGGPADTNTFNYTNVATGTNNCQWACKNGFITGADGNSCVCPAGKYQNLSSCADCPTYKGYLYSETGSTSINQCRTVCSAGQYVQSPSYQCGSCPSGKTSDEHVVYRGNSSECGGSISCSKGKYLNSSTNTCENCPSGRTTTGNGATSVTQCYIEFTVGFNKNGATTIGRTSDSCKAFCTTTSNCPSNCTVSPNSITRDGWQILGWNTSPSATNAVYTTSQQITLSSNINYYAITSQTCQAGTYTAGGSVCSNCGEGKYKTSSSTKYNTQTNPTDCSNCTNKPDHAYYTNSAWTNNNCPWACEEGFVQYKDETDGKQKCGCPAGQYYSSSNKRCEVCPNKDNGYTSDTGATAPEQCYVKCSCGEVVTDPKGKCTSCLNNKNKPQGMAVSGHKVYRGSISSKYGYECKACTNTPSNAYHPSNYCDYQHCSFACNQNHYRDNEKNECQPCNTQYGYTSPAGSSGGCACTVNCPAGYHLTGTGGPGGPCEPCPVGTASPSHVASGCIDYMQNVHPRRNCTGCINGPKNKATYPLNVGYEYTSRGTTINNCSWRCLTGYYKSGENCLPCGDGYTSPAGSTSLSACEKLAECGSANGGYFATQPTNNLCNPGSVSNMVAGYGMWNGYGRVCPANADPKCMSEVIGWSWNCSREINGVTYTVSCMANKGASCESPCNFIDRAKTQPVPISHGSTETCYLYEQLYCPSSCRDNAQTKTCYNGTWIGGSFGAYTKGSCTQKPVNTDYTLPRCHTGSSICNSAHRYDVSNNTCVDQGIKYKVTSCQPGFYMSYGVCMYDEGSSSRGSCFLAGTPVLTPDGSKNIEDIEEGDLVLSYNANHEFEYNKVLYKFVHENSSEDIYTFVISGDVLDVTPNHPFYVVDNSDELYQCNLPYRWISAKYLKVGDQLMMSDGTLVTIDKISRRPNYGTTYNLNVENASTYFVGKGYLVHNAKVNPTDPGKPGWGGDDNDEVYCECAGWEWSTNGQFGGYSCCPNGAAQMDGGCAFGGSCSNSCGHCP